MDDHTHYLELRTEGLEEVSEPEPEPLSVKVTCPRCKAMHVAEYLDGVLVAYLILNGAQDCKPCAVLKRLGEERFQD